MAEFILETETVTVAVESRPHEVQQLVVTRGTDAAGYGFSARFGLQNAEKTAWDETSYKVINLDADTAQDARLLLFCAVLPDPASLPEPYRTVYGAALARMQARLDEADAGVTLAGQQVQQVGVHLFGLLGERVG